MRLFKKEQPAEFAEDQPLAQADAESLDEALVNTFDRTNGPFDQSEVEEIGDRLDLGALWVPLTEGLEVQLQVDDATGAVTGGFMVLGESGVQVQAFAAPRTAGIWAEVCEDIAVGITEQGGTVDWGYGRFGRELLARVPAQLPDGTTSFQPLRFTGVDGPRWMLRAVFHGQAAVAPEEASELVDLVANLVVVRGSDPMGPRELLPLQLPDGAQALDEAGQVIPELDPFERGPEITEIR